MKPINVLSCFDGMSCGQLALQRASIKVKNYYSFEIDKYAMKVTQEHYPNTIQLGDINNWKGKIDEIEIPDLIIGGSPCQGFSLAGKGLNFDDPRSKLFFVFVDILRFYKSKNPNLKFILENVKMKKEWSDKISEILGVQPVLIDSALVSAQSRKRLYWANFPLTQPKDKGIVLADILNECGDVDREKSYTIDANYFKGGNEKSYAKGRRQIVYLPSKSHSVRTSGRGSFDRHSWDMIPVRSLAHGYIKSEIKLRSKYPSLVGQDPSTKYLIEVGKADDIKGYDVVRRIYASDGKSPTLTNMQGGHRQPKVAIDKEHYRKLTPIECERLQTVPDNWTSMVSNTQRYKMLGNGWTIDVIVHILNCMKENATS